MPETDLNELFARLASLEGRVASLEKRVGEAEGRITSLESNEPYEVPTPGSENP